MKIISNHKLENQIVFEVLKPIAKKNNINSDLWQSEFEYSKCLRNYLIWKFIPHYIEHFPTDTRYLNMYYWLVSFYKRYELKIGIDVGIEQQISDLIFEMSNAVSNVKWDEIEKLNLRIDEEINNSMSA